MRQWDFLKTSLVAGRLSHAYIFSGNDKVKKEQAAESLVQQLNCETSCKKCDSCYAIAKDRHPDVHVIRPAQGKDITIGQMREVLKAFQLGNWNSDWKIAVIHNAHTMNQEAQSAFLKLLEEPRGSSLFILLTEHSALLLDTIRSRAQELNFYFFDTAISKGKLAAIEKESIAQRFVLAKKLSESTLLSRETIEEWAKDARTRMLKEIEEKGSAGKWRNVVQVAEKTKEILNNTNVSSRAALEQFLIAL